MIVLIRIQDAFTPLPLRVILMISACFYMDMNCFGPVRVVSSLLRVGLVDADIFMWVVVDGFGWLRMVSGGFEWFRVVCCFSSYDSVAIQHRNLQSLSIEIYKLRIGLSLMLIQ